MWSLVLCRTLQVDFIWINRDQRSFEWFVSLLTKLEMDQADEEPEGETVAAEQGDRLMMCLTWLWCGSGRFLEMHMYMTSALSKNDMKAIGLQMALDLLAKKEMRDSITGLRTRTQPGRPDWGKVRPNEQFHCPSDDLNVLLPDETTSVRSWLSLHLRTG